MVIYRLSYVVFISDLILFLSAIHAFSSFDCPTSKQFSSGPSGSSFNVFVSPSDIWDDIKTIFELTFRQLLQRFRSFKLLTTKFKLRQHHELVFECRKPSEKKSFSATKQCCLGQLRPYWGTRCQPGSHGRSYSGCWSCPFGVQRFRTISMNNQTWLL